MGSRIRRSRTLGGYVVLAAGVLGLGACGGLTEPGSGADQAPTGNAVQSGARQDAGDGASAGPGAPGASGEEGADGADATRPVAADAQPFTFAFAGDVHFERHLARLLDKPATSLADLRPTMGKADVSAVNLETAITERGRPAPKRFTFRASAKALDALAGAGVDVAGMANNHSYDFGDDGFADTLAAKAKSPIPVIGVGKNAAEAYAPHIVDVKGSKLALLASTDLVEWTTEQHTAKDGAQGVAASSDPARLVEAVRAARKQVDVVAVIMHWGTEGMSCPSDRQKATVARLRDAGAHIIVGTHAHRVQGAGWKDNVFVGYGVGNFVWYRADEPSSRSGVLTMTVDPRLAADAKKSVVTASTWTPMLIRSDGVPREPESTATRARLAKVYDDAVACSDLATSPPQ